MTSMAQLAEAAANVPAVGFRLEDVVPDVVPDDPKRKRLSGIPMARAKVANKINQVRSAQLLLLSGLLIHGLPY